jgi:hypothetical protein
LSLRYTSNPQNTIDMTCGELGFVSAGAVLALAWGLILSRYTGKDDVLFGLGLESQGNAFSNKPIFCARALGPPVLVM